MLFAPFPVAGSVQTAPALRVTFPVKAIALDVPLVEAKVTVPEMLVAPCTVNAREQLNLPPVLIVNAPKLAVTPVVVMFNIAPLLMVTEPAAV